jgi:hypothetical protein
MSRVGEVWELYFAPSASAVVLMLSGVENHEVDGYISYIGVKALTLSREGNNLSVGTVKLWHGDWFIESFQDSKRIE